MQQAGAPAGMGEMQLQCDAFVILVPREGPECRGAEEVADVIEGMDEQFCVGVPLWVWARLELIQVAGGGGAFPQQCRIAGPMVALQADLADGCGVDVAKLMELGECLTGRFLHENRFARPEQPGEDIEVRLRCRTYEN